jgi:hypothetical protein
VLCGESVFQVMHGRLWRRWRAAGKSGRMILCSDCTDSLTDWLRDREAEDVLSALPTSGVA